MKRRTIEKEVSLSGIGLHKGENINLTLKPNGDDSEVGRGIIFKRIDITDKDNIIKVMSTRKRQRFLKLRRCLRSLNVLIIRNIRRKK